MILRGTRVDIVDTSGFKFGHCIGSRGANQKVFKFGKIIRSPFPEFSLFGIIIGISRVIACASK